MKQLQQEHSILSPGQLVEFRGRTWIVLPSENPKLMLFRPLGGSEEEVTGVYAPLAMPGDDIATTTLAPPTVHDLGHFGSAKLLFDAARLSFRNASGPFRCMGKLSFRPRAYQVVPLVMALQQKTVRLLIADDVGVGKTVEALMILKELLERGEIRRFAILCLPHLCEQWQRELKDKLDIEAEIIRSSTIASLDRRLPNDDHPIYHHLPAQVISIDFVKSDRRRPTFVANCPELVIVDEAHTCTLPAGASRQSSQQRYHLLHDIAKRPNQHLLLLTATPHSGKDDEFKSLLGLLDKEFETYELEGLAEAKRKKIAQHFIQRKRASIERWHRDTGTAEETPFPKREAKEHPYKLSPAYAVFYDRVLRFARGITQGGKGEQQQRIRYWAALALLRGVMSSPATALEMLRNRQGQPDEEVLETIANRDRLVSDGLEVEHDQSEAELIEFAALDAGETNTLCKLSSEAAGLLGVAHDWKLKRLADSVATLLREGHSPIVFCRFIASAKYVGEHLKQLLPDNIHTQVVTSELADEQRREVIDRMGAHTRRVLVATDCLSEGINLQEHFSAVVHYDLPWNPNRIEQREGRVDRFGQPRKEVKTILIYGEDNPIDRTVFNILIKKVRDIQRAIGVQINIGEENTSIMDAVIKDILLGRESLSNSGQQLNMFAETQIQNELDTARRKAENLRHIFAHEAVSKKDIEAQLAEVDEAIGDALAVERFVCQAVRHLGGQTQALERGWELVLDNLPAHLRDHFDLGRAVRVSFFSPTPSGYRYIGRNHRFVEEICQYLMGQAFEPTSSGNSQVARAAVIVTPDVTVKTTLIQFRVRNVIKEVQGKREVIAEEMFLWGYRNLNGQVEELDYTTAKQLLLTAKSQANLSPEAQVQRFEAESQQFAVHSEAFQRVAIARAEHLVQAHAGYKQLVGGKRFEAVNPVLPPDLMGVYILMPSHSSH